MKYIKPMGLTKQEEESLKSLDDSGILNPEMQIDDGIEIIYDFINEQPKELFKNVVVVNGYSCAFVQKIRT